MTVSTDTELDSQCMHEEEDDGARVDSRQGIRIKSVPDVKRSDDMDTDLDKRIPTTD